MHGVDRFRWRVAFSAFFCLFSHLPVAEFAEVTERLLRAACDPLDLGELVAEGDEELAVAFPLVGRQGEDAGHVVSIWRLFLLRKVANDVGTLHKNTEQKV